MGWLVGIGAIAIPGLGPFIAAGSIMATLSGAAAGAALGGVTGALIGFGIPEYEAKRYEGKIKEGNLLISVHTDNSSERERAKTIFEEAGAEDISYGRGTRVSTRVHTGSRTREGRSQGNHVRSPGILSTVLLMA